MRGLLMVVVAAIGGMVTPVAGSLDIFQAVAEDSMHEIKKALRDGANIDQKDPQSGQTPLMRAVLSGKLQAVKFLLKRGADVKIPEKDGYTPMHGAGFQGRPEITKVLLAHGLDVNDKHSDGHGPVQRAIWGREARHVETARIMLEAGAKLSGDERPNGHPAMAKLVEEWLAKQRKEDL